MGTIFWYFFELCLLQRESRYQLKYCLKNVAMFLAQALESLESVPDERADGGHITPG